MIKGAKYIMEQHIATIGNYHITKELDDDRFLYNIYNNGVQIEQTTSLEKAHKFLQIEVFEDLLIGMQELEEKAHKRAKKITTGLIIWACVLLVIIVCIIKGA
jgi:hypothetical protein